ncbi:MAG TPA: tRNA 2-selenouridine(34) synthase MnmH [Bacteroidia bacterium]|nr:tRNA 2-selenouridine(34) synthase MnmH [Bacteroidia bacterium]
MPVIIEIDEFWVLGKEFPIVDVRSPAEFAHGHIPGAVNIPVFSNEERALIGTLYKQKSPEAAMEAGLEIVAPKLMEYAKLGQNAAKDNKLLVHCWRGGLRSSSMAQLFETAGIETWLLKGGYKTYRNAVLTGFDLNLDIRIVAGETGSGKTEILQALHEMGEQIIDLEQLASHRGSSFGSIGMNEQPSVENFENNLLDALKKIDPARRVWFEDESRSIGRVYIPDPLWKRMENAPVYRVQVPFDVRIQRLITDYGNFPPAILQAALERIRKRLGGLDYKNAVHALETGDLATATALALKYYDKAYDHPHKERNYKGVTMISCDSGDPKANALKIFATTESQKNMT